MSLSAAEPDLFSPDSIASGSIDKSSIIATAVKNRQAALMTLDPKKQAQYGQFLTPDAVAELMVDCVELPSSGTVKVLEPGAGTGMLSAVLMKRVLENTPGVHLDITAVENDVSLLPALGDTLAVCEALGASIRIVSEDYIRWALQSGEQFDVILQNPPYYKLGAGSETSKLLRQQGVIVPNIYAAFMALGAWQLAAGGQQVSITPRSWMNGTYYSSFRQEYVKENAIRTIHTCESRSRIFGDMDVLQEAVIVAVSRSGGPKRVKLKFSRDQHEAPVSRVVAYGDVVTEDFVFVPARQSDTDAVAQMACMSTTLADLGLSVSTGKVVDFRNRELLHIEKSNSTFPMVYQHNIKNSQVVHPAPHIKKPQWFSAAHERDKKLLVPQGTYVLVKRFSTKEEKRRIVAAVFSGDGPAAFDNKLNYIHKNGEGLDAEIALGIARWLNSAQVDDYFRVFSGHTQVNATDLRRMKFPTEKQLRSLAKISGKSDDAVTSLFLD